MKDAAHRTGSALPVQGEGSQKKKRTNKSCSICTRRIWLDPVHLIEPEGVPEPRLSWTLCDECHRYLMTEMNRSPVRSPLRLRIAIAMVAAERWPMAYTTRVRTQDTDHRWIVLLSVGFFVAMLLHLVIIVLIGLTMH
jgi:hypothetical protein